MNKRLKLSCLSLFLALVICSCSSQKKYSYETVPNDPLKARIYTLDNGLKVYLTVNKETPRIQTFIAVRVGGKNDPAETTGLAHYFEHLMFKGTDKFGTKSLCWMQSNNSSKFIVRLRMKRNVRRSTTPSTAFLTKLPSMLSLMNMTN